MNGWRRKVGMKREVGLCVAKRIDLETKSWIVGTNFGKDGTRILDHSQSNDA